MSDTRLNTFTTHARPIRSERATFVRRIDLSGGLRVTGLVEFPYEIHWLRDTSASAKLLGPDGRDVAGATNYCDWHVPASAVTSALEETQSRDQRDRLCSNLYRNLGSTQFR